MRPRNLLACVAACLALVSFSSLPLSAAPSNVITVTNRLDETANGNGCSLREAIINSNNNAKTHADCAAGSGADQIRFGIGSGTQTIVPNSELPAITDPVTIDGTTQPSCNAPCIALDGVNAGAAADGLEITAGNTTIKGLVVQRFRRNGIYFWLRGGNTVLGNYVGTDVTGMAGRGNGVHGVYFLVPDNTAGGTNPGDRNVISGNGKVGLLFCCDRFNGNNRAMGNYIGTNKNGTAAIPNGWFGLGAHSPNNIIGGTTPAARNLISGNEGGGISLCCDDQATGNQVIGNWIGLDVSGVNRIPNLEAGIGLYSPRNMVGGTAPGTRNIISGNSEVAINVCCNNEQADGNVIQGNWLGPDVTGKRGPDNFSVGVYILGVGNTLIGGPQPGEGNRIAFNALGGVRVTTGDEVNFKEVRDRIFSIHRELTEDLPPDQEPKWGTPINNRIQRNSIYNNEKMGIDLHTFGVQQNDGGDGDNGPNHLQNYPVVTSAVRATGIVRGELRSKPNATYTVEFYLTRKCDATNFGEGRKYLGATTVTTNGSGVAALNVTSGKLKPNAFVTATATDANNNTSEFSQCRRIT